MSDKTSCRWRTEEVESVRANQTEHGPSPFVIAFPRLPADAVVLEVIARFDDWSRSNPSSYLLRYEVPAEEGDILPPCDDPECLNCAKHAA